MVLAERMISLPFQDSQRLQGKPKRNRSGLKLPVLVVVPLVTTDLAEWVSSTLYILVLSVRMALHIPTVQLPRGHRLLQHGRARTHHKVLLIPPQVNFLFCLYLGNEANERIRWTEGCRREWRQKYQWKILLPGDTTFGWVNRVKERGRAVDNRLI